MTFEIIAQTVVLVITILGGVGNIARHIIDNGRRIDRLEWTVGQLCQQNNSNSGSRRYILPPGKAGLDGSAAATKADNES